MGLFTDEHVHLWIARVHGYLSQALIRSPRDPNSEVAMLRDAPGTSSYARVAWAHI